MTLTWTGAQVATSLTAPGLAGRLDTLGFRPDDRDDALAWVERLTPADHDTIAAAAGLLIEHIGVFYAPESPFEGLTDQPGRPRGLLPMMALVATADDVRRYHAGRGVPDDVSVRTLTDLGQQIFVHRQTFGEFGLHTQGWMTRAWSGGLYWLGRLQFNLDHYDGRWVWSTHIPQAGPLTPQAVDDAFARAEAFFPRHFADHPVEDFYCASWLLDPYLATAVPTSNVAAFQQRWRLVGEPRPGDGDVLFFVFHRRGEVDLASLPGDTSLRRAVLDRLTHGEHWQTCVGLIPRPGCRAAAQSS